MITDVVTVNVRIEPYQKPVPGGITVNPEPTGRDLITRQMLAATVKQIADNRRRQREKIPDYERAKLEWERLDLAYWITRYTLHLYSLERYGTC